MFNPLKYIICNIFPLNDIRRHCFVQHILPFLGILIVDLLIIIFYSPITMWMANLVIK